jgi:hypothetical protein
MKMWRIFGSIKRRNGTWTCYYILLEMCKCNYIGCTFSSHREELKFRGDTVCRKGNKLLGEARFKSAKYNEIVSLGWNGKIM